MEYLVTKGSDVSAVDAFGNNALQLVAKFARRPIIRMLMKRGADSSVPEHRAPPPMELPPEVSKLFGPGTLGFLIGTNVMKGTALHHAAVTGNIDAAKELVEGGVDPSSPNVMGSTAAQVAANAGMGCAEYLESVGKDNREPSSPTSPTSPPH